MSFVDVFFGEGNELSLSGLSTAARARLDPWLQRWQEGRGPSFLPRLWSGRLAWYGLAADEQQRREIQDLLVHWVGPARSDIALRHGALDLTDPFDAALGDLAPGRVIRLEVRPHDATASEREIVRDRLEGLVSLLDARPRHPATSSAALPALLDDLDIAAASGNVDRAEALLEEIASRRLLDAPNTTFLAVRVRSLLGHHEHILEEGTLRKLEGLRLPGGTVLALARSFYESRLRHADEGGDTDQLLAVRQGLATVLRDALRQGPPSAEHAVVVARAVVGGGDGSFGHLLRSSLLDEPHLRPLLDAGGLSRPDKPPGSEPVAEKAVGDRLSGLYGQRAYEAVIDMALRADDVAALDRREISTVVHAAAELEDRRRATQVLDLIDRRLGSPLQVDWSSRLTLAAVEILQERVTPPEPDVPSGWKEWFQAVSDSVDPDPKVMRDAGDWEALDARQLRDAIDSLPSPERLTPVVGRLWTAHRPSLDVESRASLARHLLTVIGMSERRGESIRDAALALVSDALDGALTGDDARDLVQTARDIILEQMASATFPWVIDVRAELGAELSRSHRDALLSLDQEIVGEARKLADSITRSEWEDLRSLLLQVGLDVPPDVSARLAERDEPDPFRGLEGLKILLYSLRQRAARQAAARLQGAGADVTLSAEHDASPQLTGQVAGADLVIMVTAAAKHAATNAIESAGPRSLLRVNSAGMTAILKEVEAWCRRLQPAI